MLKTMLELPASRRRVANDADMDKRVSRAWLYEVGAKRARTRSASTCAGWVAWQMVALARRCGRTQCRVLRAHAEQEGREQAAVPRNNVLGLLRRRNLHDGGSESGVSARTAPSGWRTKSSRTRRQTHLLRLPRHEDVDCIRAPALRVLGERRDARRRLPLEADAVIRRGVDLCAERQTSGCHSCVSASARQCARTGSRAHAMLSAWRRLIEVARQP